MVTLKIKLPINTMVIFKGKFGVTPRDGQKATVNSHSVDPNKDDGTFGHWIIFEDNHGMWAHPTELTMIE